jgi:hypothetical protein
MLGNRVFSTAAFVSLSDLGFLLFGREFFIIFILLLLKFRIKYSIHKLDIIKRVKEIGLIGRYKLERLKITNFRRLKVLYIMAQPRQGHKLE